MQLPLLENLRARLRELKLDGYEAHLLPHARLAFDLRLDGPANGSVGESRWGGVPDVPAAFEWPREGEFSLTFLCQINLADLLQDDENPFPAAGLLQFFIDPEDDAYFITIQNADNELFPATLPADTNDIFGELPPHHLKLEPRADLPQWATDDYVELTSDLSDEEQDAYSDLALSDVYAPTPQRQSLAGQLLGHTAGIGYDPRQDAFAARELGEGYPFEHENPTHRSGAKLWHNLLRFDSALQFSIGDCGYFNFLIHEDDLIRLDFSRIYTSLESS